MSDVLKLGFMEYHGKSQKDKSLLILSAGSTQGITNREEFGQRVAEYVHLNTLENRPVPLHELSRRFARVALSVAVPLQDVIAELISHDKVVAYKRGNRTLLLSAISIEERRAIMPDEIEAIIEQILGNTH